MNQQAKADRTIFRSLHRIFQIGLILKGLNAALELIGGTALLLIPAIQIKSWLLVPLQIFDQWHPSGFLATWLGNYIQRLSAGTQEFVAWYFLSHGILKILVVICLMKQWLWAYPVSLVIFGGFMGFQSWEFFWGNHSWFYIFLDVFDGLLIFLTINEWKHAKAMLNLH